MRISLAASFLVLGSTALFAQAVTPEPSAASKPAPAGTASPAHAAAPATPSTPAAAPAAAPAPPPEVHDTEVGFSYSLPSDWEFVSPPPAPKVAVPYPTVEAPKKGGACVEVVLTAKHGAPASVVVVLDLPFACYGQTMTPGDLTNFGAGAAEGLKQSFEITDPVEGTYAIGSHTMWMERAKGTPKHHPENPFTFEIACTVLEKGAACWMTMAADAASLQAFEQGAVSLDGEAPTALVPTNAFLPNKPS